MKTNYHTHTPHCGHALGKSTAEYADAAFDAGLEILGFSDHCPFKDHDFGCRMKYEELETYFSEVDELKEKYKGKMDILKGVEIEYLPEYAKAGNNFYEYLLREKKLDYLLMGEHFFIGDKNKTFNLYNIPGPEIIIDYANTCVEGMKTGYFKMLAHPDLFGVNDYPWDKNMERATDIIINGALKYDVILEYNANGYRRGVKDFVSGERYMYPMPEFWKKVSEAKAKVIVGSDSHNPKEIWDDAIEKARKDLKDLGISFIETI